MHSGQYGMISRNIIRRNGVLHRQATYGKYSHCIASLPVIKKITIRHAVFNVYGFNTQSTMMLHRALSSTANMERKASKRA